MTCIHAAVSALIFPSTSVRTETANPATQTAPEPRNQTIQCSAQSLSADGNRRPPAPGHFGLIRAVPMDFLSCGPISFLVTINSAILEASRTFSPYGGGANSSAALCGFLSPGKLWSLSRKDFTWHLGVHYAPCPFRQYVPIHSRPNSKGEHHVQLQKQRPPRRQPRQRRRKEDHSQRRCSQLQHCRQRAVGRQGRRRAQEHRLVPDSGLGAVGEVRRHPQGRDASHH